jgi:3-hydroxyisobutyrate dehydrogenase-like beta-hydroxyacid dehydrogenase
VNIGFIGLGKMGQGMARNLMQAGHRLTVYNRTPERAQELQAEGALVAETPAAACQGEAVISCLADDRAIEAVAFGEHGLVGGLGRGCIHLSMSTLSLAMLERLDAAHREAGERFVAAPVFGRPDAAAAAKLLIVASGEAATLSDCQPLFEVMGQRTFVVGTSSLAAGLVKLVGNFLLVSAIESLGEAITLLKKSGIDAEGCMDMLTSTLFAAPVYKNYSALMLKDNYEPGFRLALGLKDIGLALSAAESFASPMPIGALVRERLVKAIEQGLEDRDIAALALVSAKDAGLKVQEA